VSQMTRLKAPDTLDSMRAIIERAQTGDKQAIPALRELLERMPEFLVETGAHLERTVEYSISKSLGGEENLAFREGLRSKLAVMRKELEGPNPSPIERLLVDRIVACWLQVQDADLRYAQAGNCSFAQGTYHMKRQDRSNRRFLAAIKTLANVRKLGRRVLQVNIGENQVNLDSMVSFSGL